MALSATVSIPQWCDCCPDGADAVDSERKEFQSHNGAIAAYGGLNEFEMGMYVSIPQWCDCCPTIVKSGKITHTFQSHNGAIAALDGKNAKAIY